MKTVLVDRISITKEALFSLGLTQDYNIIDKLVVYGIQTFCLCSFLRKGVEPVGRLLLILSAACLVITFVILWKIPFDPAKIYSSFKNEADNTRPAVDSNPVKKPDTPQAISSKKRTRADSSKAMSATDKGSNVRDVEPAPESEVGQDASQKNVKSDSAAVYSVNSPDSAILKLLKKGDRIETDIEVIDTEGRWSLVKGAKERRSGYVRSENLETKQPAKRKN